MAYEQGSHKLGSAGGTLRVDIQRGVVSYVPNMKVLAVASWPLLDAEGASSTKSSFLKYVVTVYGRGTTLAVFDGVANTAQLIDAWIRTNRPNEGSLHAGSEPAVGAASSSMADDLERIAALHAAGVLDDDEFKAAKLRVLNP